MKIPALKYNGKPLIWPIPNECIWKEGFFLIPDKVGLTCDEDFSGEVELFKHQLSSFDIHTLECSTGGALIISKCSDARISEEGYTLEVTPQSIVVEASTPAGVFYGLQTLLQLISNAENRQMPAVFVVDSPFKKVRGVHIYVPPRKELQWFKRYLDFLAKYKFNTIYLELGAAMKFDSHPEINEAWESFCKEMLAYPGGPDGYGMQMSVGHFKDSVHIENGGGSYLEKFELEDIIKYAKARHLEIIPEVQSLAHSYWLLLAHRECAERTDDPYPDTYCPSNPRTYEILFDCMEEIVELFRPKTIHIGHDEFYSIGFCEKCKTKTGHDILYEDIMRLYNWLKERGIKTLIWADKLFEYTAMREDGMPCSGSERLNFNRRVGKSEVMRPTCRAVDMLPNDIVLGDWHHSLSDEDTGSQDYFGHRGFDVIFGNFDDIRWRGIPNLEDRLRRPNVIGAECSCWQETSDLGLASKDMLVRYLDIANILWYENYKLSMKYSLNNIIAQIYPLERDKLNGSPSCVLDNKGFKHIDITRFYNVPLNWVKDYSFITQTEKLPNTIHFDLCKSVENVVTDPACVMVGHGECDILEGISVGDSFRSIAFLHSYTVNMGNTALRPCTYVGRENDLVGYYIITYSDNTQEKVPVEYSKTITSIEHEFDAYWANPVYQTADVEEEIVGGRTSKSVKLKASPKVVFSYEWKNPFPDKVIQSISIQHLKDNGGGIIVFGITGIR